MPEDFTSHHHWYSATISSLSSTNMPSSSDEKPLVVDSYNDALHGFSAVLFQDELESLKQTTGLISAHSDRKVTLDTTQTYEFLSLSPSHESESFSDYGFATKIPARWKGGCEGGHDLDPSLCNSKLIDARYFNKGVLAGRPYVNISMASARDNIGHGTHTSSLAAGNYVGGVSYFGYAKGIAAHAKLAMYKVTWPEEKFGSDVLAGLDQAIADGVDVISISMGFDREMKVRNLGHNGTPWVLNVAASNIGRTFAGTLTLGNGHSIVGWSLFPANAMVENFPLIYNKTFSACSSSCSFPRARSAIIICDASKSVNEQIDHVAAAQVYGAVFISEDPQLYEMGSMTCPGVVISPKDAKAVIYYAKTSDLLTASKEFQQTFVGTELAPTVATYSSRGPSWSYPGILKPDIMAPGSMILAAWPPNVPAAEIGTNVFLANDYNFLSWTSMACPHASGVAALLKMHTQNGFLLLLGLQWSQQPTR
ncbi:Subtilisin-like protease [Quillaja saponaria]|uniref:Subtilisin-like protease n=1 Tax=Quillaja saponaria TaxID=32244 RepID=A0AAD7QBA1_QUISA|nr:Subtilisin-like protease [Quillaja saponaria]